ncbi:metalloendopeptidase, partial [Coemansia biformis]
MFANVIALLGHFSASLAVEGSVASLLGSVTIDMEARGAGNQAKKLKADFEIEHTMREDVYKVVRAMKCTNDEDARLLFSHDELEGLPKDYFDGQETEDDADGEIKYVVTSKYLDYLPLMKYAKQESTWKAMLVTDENRCPDNIPQLQELMKLWLEQAQLLGYNTYSEYALEVLMAKTPQAALDMEEDLLARVAAPAKRELAELEALKKADMEAAGEPYTGFYHWDRPYYAQLVVEQRHKLKSEEVKQYFPLAQATRGMLDIYQKMLGLRVVQVDNELVWHPDVETYEAWEANEDVFVGHFYLNLYPHD